MIELLERRARLAIAAVALLSAVPLLMPAIPPLTDLMGHLGRYRVQLDLAGDPLLQRYYSFDWAMIPNLGVDLLVGPFSAIFGLELGVKLIVISIAIATAAGLLLVGKTAQGRWPIAGLFALSLVYSYPFHFGFVNYCLAMALAFLFFAGWIHLGNAGRIAFRAALFVPLSLIIWLAHVSGWGALGVFAFAAEYERMRSGGIARLRAMFMGGLHCLPLTLPMLLMVGSRDGAEGRTFDFFNFDLKWEYLRMALSDQWQVFDYGSVVLLLALIASAALVRSLLRLNHTLGLGAMFLAIAFLILPRVLFGSAYADMRLAPYALAMGLLAIEPRQPDSRGLINAFLIAGLVFFTARLAATTASFIHHHKVISAELKAVDHIPAGSRVMALTGRTCYTQWQQERRTHLASMALARKRAYINDQFLMNGAQLIGVHYPAAGRFRKDPSQMAVGDRCFRPDWKRLADSVREFPREAFDYLWVINPPPSAEVDYSGLQEIWRWRTSRLFRIPAQPAATPRTAAEPAQPGAAPARTGG